MGLVDELQGSRICIDTAPLLYFIEKDPKYPCFCLSGTRPQSRSTELETFGTNPCFVPSFLLAANINLVASFIYGKTGGIELLEKNTSSCEGKYTYEKASYRDTDISKNDRWKLSVCG